MQTIVLGSYWFWLSPHCVSTLDSPLQVLVQVTCSIKNFLFQHGVITVNNSNQCSASLSQKKH